MTDADDAARPGFAWLADLLRQAGVKGAHDLPADLGEDADKAWEAAASRCHLSQGVLAQLVASRYKLEVWGDATPDPALARRLSERFCRNHQILAAGQQDGALLVLTSDPDRLDLQARLHALCNQPVRLVVAPPPVIAMHTMSVFSSVAENVAGLGLFDLDQRAPADAAASVRLVNLMLREAIQKRASDIHVQPLMGGGEVRFRIDGVLSRMGLLPRAALQRLIGRFKAVAGMDSTDRLRPDDGHARVLFEGQTYDLRLSTVPVEGQEKLVIRFLARLAAHSVARLGIGEPELGQLTNLLEHGAGLLLVTGPTGSGKTTTLYAALAEKNRAEVNIVTVEDPVEYHIARLTQIQTNPKADLNFATALRAVLRQDPDIVLIGEIRDAETAEIALQAAMTGHLVLATLHTNDALGAIARLTDLGISAGLLAEALIGTTAQRLIRTLCLQCATPATEPYTAQESWVMQHAAVARPMRPFGCEACHFRGYRGRTAICQVLEVDEDIAESIAGGEIRQRLERQASAQGMRSLAASALSRITEGISTVAEAQRVVGRTMWRTLAREHGVAPPLIADGAADTAAPEDGVRRVLLIARYPERREALRRMLVETGHPVDAEMGVQPARHKLSQRPDHGLIVVDLEDLVPDLVQALLDMRSSLSGAALPVLLLGDDPQAKIVSTLHYADGVLLAPHPQSPEDWHRLVERAFALDHDGEAGAVA